jgi:hypothetical protein
MIGGAALLRESRLSARYALTGGKEAGASHRCQSHHAHPCA